MKTIKEITPNSIVIIRFCYQKSIQVINNFAYPVDISEWIVKIFNGLGTELFEYKFPAGASLPAKKIVNLWSKTAKGDRPVLRNDLILVPNCHRHNWSDKSIWLDRRMDLCCLIYDENMNVGLFSYYFFFFKFGHNSLFLTSDQSLKKSIKCRRVKHQFLRNLLPILNDCSYCCFFLSSFGIKIFGKVF